MPTVTKQKPPAGGSSTAPPRSQRTTAPQTQTTRSDGPATRAGPLSVLDRIGPIGFGEDDGLKCLVYGRSGTGKTTLWATFPGPILVMICSGGDKPGELRSIDTPEYREKVRRVVLAEAGELLELVAAAPGLGFGTVVLDHATGFQDLVLKEILGLSEIPAQKSWGLASQQQYGQCTMMCKDYFRALFGLDCNVVLVAQEREFRPEGESELSLLPTVGAGLTPSLAGWVYTAADYILHTYLRPREVVKKVKQGEKVIEMRRTDGVEFCLRTGPDPVYTTKFRVPKGTPLPHTLEDPDYGKIRGLVKGEGRKAVSAVTAS